MYDAFVNAAAFILLILLVGRLFDVFMDFIIGILVRLLGPNFAYLIANVFTFIGVMHHELSHALFAFLTGAKVKKIQLFSIFNLDGTLGSVQFVPRGGLIRQSIQLCASSIAPMITGFISLYFIYNSYLNGVFKGVGLIFMFYVAISILFHMRLSTQDILVALKGLPICFIILCMIFYILNVDILDFFNSFNISALQTVLT